MSDFEYLSVDAEALRILNIRRRNGDDAARQALNALLDRPKRLTGLEHRHALDFNAHLVGALRMRGCNLWAAPIGSQPTDVFED